MGLEVELPHISGEINRLHNSGLEMNQSRTEVFFCCSESRIAWRRAKGMSKSKRQHNVPPCAGLGAMMFKSDHNGPLRSILFQPVESHWCIDLKFVRHRASVILAATQHNAHPPVYQMCTHRSQKKQCCTTKGMMTSLVEVQNLECSAAWQRGLQKSVSSLQRSSPHGGGWLIIIVQMGHGCHYFWSHDCIHRACFPLFFNLGRQWGYSDGGNSSEFPPKLRICYTVTSRCRSERARTRTRPRPQTEALKGKYAECRYKTGIFDQIIQFSVCFRS